MNATWQKSGTALGALLGAIGILGSAACSGENGIILPSMPAQDDAGAATGGGPGSTIASPNDPLADGGTTAAHDGSLPLPPPPPPPPADGGPGTIPVPDAGTTPVPGGAAILLPLAVGRVWTFDVYVDNSQSIPGSALLHCTQSVQITGTGVLAARNVFVGAVSTSCADGTSNLTTSYWAVNGDVVDAPLDAYGTQWERATDAPVQIGHTWYGAASLGYEYAWTATGSVTTAAGTFGDCWTAQRSIPSRGVTGASVYCRGVGMVHDDTDYGVGYQKSRSELLSKNF